MGYNSDMNIVRVVILPDDVRYSIHATVWKGELTTTCLTHKSVALKELRDCSPFTEDDRTVNILKRLPEYVAVAQSLDHANICKVFGLSRGPGLVPLLVLPYFPHRDIVSYLTKHLDKNDKDKIKLTVHILRAIVYLHANGVVHGCLHGGNVLVDETENAVISDVKLDSLMFGDDQYYLVHSKCWWMPRERLIVDDADAEELALGPVSMEADLYSAALTIAQLWTLRRPFSHMRNKYKFVIMLQTLTTDELASLALPEEVPHHVSGLLRDCLNDDPRTRPTAKSLLANFEALL